MSSVSTLLGLFFLTQAGQRSATAAAVGARMRNATAVSIEQYPFLVSLDQSYGASVLHYCTGAIISSSWVLTSARCTASESVGSLVVRAGSARVSQGSRYEAAEIITHPNYTSPEEPFNDIALVKVRTPFLLGSSVQAVQLAPAGSSLAAGTSTTVVGWGHPQDEDASLTDYNAHALKVSVMTNARCAPSFEDGFITDAVMCADYEQASGRMDQGDSGSPVLASGKLVGVVSWVSDYEEYYDIYTNVSTYHAWISAHTGV